MLSHHLNNNWTIEALVRLHIIIQVILCPPPVLLEELLYRYLNCSRQPQETIEMCTAFETPCTHFCRNLKPGFNCILVPGYMDIT